MVRRYYKNDCNGRNDSLHCNHYKFNRDGVECPCIDPRAREIATGTVFYTVGNKIFSTLSEAEKEAGEKVPVLKLTDLPPWPGERDET